jgi:hypothetical protein
MGPGKGWLRRATGLALASGTFLVLAAETVNTIHSRDAQEELRTLRECGLRFAARMPGDGRIVVRGGEVAHPRYGTPVAHNRSVLFAWMDRKGFTYGDEELSVDALTAISARGGRYWIAEAGELAERDAGGALATRFARVDECGSAGFLFDLLALPAPTPVD